MNSVRLTHHCLTDYLFEWTDEPLEMAVTRYENPSIHDPEFSEPPGTYLITKEQARTLWRTLLNNGYKQSPITRP